MGNPFEELIAGAGNEIPEELKSQLEKEVKNAYYVPLEGEYKALFSRLNYHYKDVEGKKCEASTAGAKLTGLSLRFIVIKDPEKSLIKDGVLDIKEDYGRLTFNQYLSIKDDDQWKNVKTLSDFTINEIPEAAIVQENGKIIKYQNLPVYVGVPVTFELKAGTKNPNSRFMQNLYLADHSKLTKEIVAQRKTIIDNLEEQLTAYKERLDAERKAKKEEGETTPTTEVVEVADNYLDEFEGMT